MTVSGSKSRRELIRFAKFSVVGAIGFVVDFGTFNLLNVRLGVYSVVASVLSFAAAVTSNFIWNRYWTYPDSRAKPIAQQAMQFTLVNLIGLAIRTPIFALSEAPMTRLAAWVKTSLPAGMPEPLVGLPDVIIGRNLALGLAVIVVLFWNFGVNRIWTYSDIS